MSGAIQSLSEMMVQGVDYLHEKTPIHQDLKVNHFLTDVKNIGNPYCCLPLHYQPPQSFAFDYVAQMSDAFQTDVTMIVQPHDQQQSYHSSNGLSDCVAQMPEAFQTDATIVF